MALCRHASLFYWENGTYEDLDGEWRRYTIPFSQGINWWQQWDLGLVLNLYACCECDDDLAKLLAPFDLTVMTVLSLLVLNTTHQVLKIGNFTRYGCMERAICRIQDFFALPKQAMTFLFTTIIPYVYNYMYVSAVSSTQVKTMIWNKEHGTYCFTI